MKAQTPALSLILVSFTLVGCGLRPGSASTAVYAPTSAYQIAPQPSVNPDPGYVCPSSANVTPGYDWDHNGTGYYTVCRNTTTGTQFQITGEPSQGNQVCVFVTEFVSNTNLAWLPDPQSGLPWAQCGTLNSNDQVVVNFANATFNSAFIVDAADEGAMAACLQTGLTYTCPQHYSFGQF